MQHNLNWPVLNSFSRRNHELASSPVYLWLSGKPVSESRGNQSFGWTPVHPNGFSFGSTEFSIITTSLFTVFLFLHTPFILARRQDKSNNNEPPSSRWDGTTPCLWHPWEVRTTTVQGWYPGWHTAWYSLLYEWRPLESVLDAPQTRRRPC
jgi:hypothetical protein